MYSAALDRGVERVWDGRFSSEMGGERVTGVQRNDGERETFGVVLDNYPLLSTKSNSGNSPDLAWGLEGKRIVNMFDGLSSELFQFLTKGGIFGDTLNNTLVRSRVLGLQEGDYGKSQVESSDDVVASSAVGE